MFIKAFLLADSRFEFTNINCTSYEKRIAEFEYCYLKSINRSYKYLSGKLKVYEIPLPNMKVNFVLWKRLNGYKPFLYNVTVDLCKFLATPKSSPVVKFVYESYVTFSNFNHSCPFNNDLYVEKLPVDFMNHRLTKILPFPEGDYLFEFLWFRSRSVIGSAKIYCTVS
ncbi:uncharacterized protein [Drosophila kikkawai]|uniref:MD-2-related lipid-recognition domain-containing protein n=1 Tax=Drosophila kikkawai TaxID=30033 RepID=A0A6P4JRQ7_DROKI|nr:uncharacterized protein LOC108085316 [Drosophila kikkawai]